VRGSHMELRLVAPTSVCEQLLTQFFRRVFLPSTPRGIGGGSPEEDAVSTVQAGRFAKGMFSVWGRQAGLCLGSVSSELSASFLYIIRWLVCGMQLRLHHAYYV
jgi:hypothetical protein